MDVFRVGLGCPGTTAGLPSPTRITQQDHVSFDAGGCSEFAGLSFFQEDDTTVTAGTLADTLQEDQSSSPLSPQQSHIATRSPGEQHYAAADSGTPAKTFVPCKVCGDKASGYHYGVTSCEGCKGFFRRSIQKQIEYRCLRDGKCLVIRLNRNRCQYCRFRKCLAVGMSRDSVRYGRVPKRSREREEALASSQNSDTVIPPSPESSGDSLLTSSSSSGGTQNGNSSSIAVVSTTTDEPSFTPPTSSVTSSPPLILDSLVNQVTQAHLANAEFSEDCKPAMKPIPPIVSCLPVLVSSSEEGSNEIATSTADTLELERVWLWQQLALRVTPTVQRVVEFAKRLPGFCDLSQDDQLILIKMGFFELWICHVSKMANDSSLSFADDTYITRQQLEVIYDSEFIGSLFNFASSFKSLGLTDSELGLFNAIVLMSTDRPGVTDVKAIGQTQDKLVEALKAQLAKSESQTISVLLGKLCELRTLGAKHSLLLDWFRANWDRLRLPPLFAEIFDIPKCEEDLQQ